jgi:Uma2 family endonuclease
MATIAPTRPTTSPPPPPPLHRITVDEYERIIRSGALEDPNRVELIDGYMVDEMAKNPEHGFSATATHQAIAGRLPTGWLARKEEPVRIPAYDEPEPDISVVRGINADYRHRVPEPADVALLIEVSDWTLGREPGVKLVAFARDGIPIYWIVNLADRQSRSTPGRRRRAVTGRARTTGPVSKSRLSSPGSDSPRSPSTTSCRDRSPRESG